MSITLTFEQLRDRVQAVLQTECVPTVAARLLAHRITSAERDGTLSHGLMRLPDYLASIRSGWITPDAVPQIKASSSPFVQVDGANGFTQVAAALAQPDVIARVVSHGISLLGIRNAHHIGALWGDIEDYGERGWVAFNFVNSRPRLAPYGSTEALLGTNAMAFAFPDGQGGVLGWDQASSGMSLGDVKQHALRGQRLPEGIGLDASGKATTQPDEVLKGGTLLPYGGHKGSGIALMVEVMAAALTGASFGYEDRSANYPGAASSDAGQTLLVIDPAFSSPAPFAARITGLIAHLHSEAGLRLPGERRRMYRQQRAETGFTVNGATAALLNLN